MVGTLSHVRSRVKLFFRPRRDAPKFNINTTITMNGKAESSTSAGKQAIKATTNGVANYELPW